MPLLLSLLLWSAAAVKPSYSEPLDGPILSAAISVRQEARGQCSEVSVGRRGQRPTIHMTDICHGWSTQGCSASLLIKAQGVTQDSAEVFFLREDRKADVVALINKEIGKVWLRNEISSLALTGVDCAGGAMVVSFEGARVPKGRSSSAYTVRGTVTLASADRITVRIKSAQ